MVDYDYRIIINGLPRPNERLRLQRDPIFAITRIAVYERYFLHVSRLNNREDDLSECQVNFKERNEILERMRE
jgi:hypothetical protein